MRSYVARSGYEKNTYMELVPQVRERSQRSGDGVSMSGDIRSDRYSSWKQFCIVDIVSWECCG